MNCCMFCLKDRKLRELWIKAQRSREAYQPTRSPCLYCGLIDTIVFSPSELREHFDVFFDIYEIDKTGKPMVDLIKNDWEIFERGSISEFKLDELLIEIFDNSDVLETCYIPSSKSFLSEFNWESLKKELMYINRFFVDNSWIKELETVLRFAENYTDSLASKSGNLWYRARIREGNQAFSLDQMGAPNSKNAISGRANPYGISYLYIASNEDTAISEVRPHVGEKIDVIDFKLKDNLDIINLENPRESLSPFGVEETNVRSFGHGIRILMQFAEELSYPVSSNENLIDYIPSQYLCEFIKSIDYDGIVYNSSVNNGSNLVLFDPKSAIIGTDLKSYIIRDVDIRYDLIS